MLEREVIVRNKEIIEKCEREGEKRITYRRAEERGRKEKKAQGRGAYGGGMGYPSIP